MDSYLTGAMWTVPATLPDELLIEIFLWLPVKCLVRFKSVSKSWLSLISDPHFALSHFHLSRARTDRFLLVLNESFQLVSIDHNVPSLVDATMKLNFLPFQPEQPSDVTILGSCRGLTLMGCDNDADMWIWNPCNGFHRKIPLPPMYSCIDFRFEFLRGFGCDPLADDYLVTLASNHRHGRSDDWNRVAFFSLRANSWTELNTSVMKGLYSSRKSYGLLLNGAIHWLASRNGRLSSIVAFNLMEKVLYEIPLPNGLPNSRFDYSLQILGGFLSFFVDPVDVWIMREYNVQPSWTRIHIVMPLLDPEYLSPLCFFASFDIVEIDGFEDPAKFVDKREVLELLVLLELLQLMEPHREYAPPKNCYVTHTDSLLSLPL